MCNAYGFGRAVRLALQSGLVILLVCRTEQIRAYIEPSSGEPGEAAGVNPKAFRPEFSLTLVACIIKVNLYLRSMVPSCFEEA